MFGNFACFLCEVVSSESDEHAEAHAREVEDSLCHYKAHREEEVGGREVGEDQEREGEGYCSVCLSAASDTPDSKPRQRAQC